MTRKLVLTAAAFGGTSIILGAFGAHALRNLLTPPFLNAFEIGVRYQMYHALFLLFIALGPISDKARRGISILTIAGVILFSGSLYILALDEALTVNLSFLGPITPIGGFLLISAWTWLFIDFVRKKT